MKASRFVLIAMVVLMSFPAVMRAEEQKSSDDQTTVSEQEKKELTETLKELRKELEELKAKKNPSGLPAPQEPTIKRPDMHDRLITAAKEVPRYRHDKWFGTDRFIHISHNTFKTQGEALRECSKEWGIGQSGEKLPKSQKTIQNKMRSAAVGFCLATGKEFATATGRPYYPHRYVFYAESEQYYLAAEGKVSE